MSECFIVSSKWVLFGLIDVCHSSNDGSLQWPDLKQDVGRRTNVLGLHALQLKQYLVNESTLNVSLNTVNVINILNLASMIHEIPLQLLQVVNLVLPFLNLLISMYICMTLSKVLDF